MIPTTPLRHLTHLLPGILLVLSAALPSLAQSPVEEEHTQQGASITELIEENSGGTVNVQIPEELLQIIINGAPQHHQQQQARPQRPRTGQGNGYRIQVFSDGRNPSTLQARARARVNAIVAKFPKYRGQVYTFSKSPNWYARVGNFTSAEQANAALAELKRAFPAFAGEMRTVRCTIIIR